MKKQEKSQREDYRQEKDYTQTKKDVTAVNLFIIREIIKSVKGNIPLPLIYVYLFDGKKLNVQLKEADLQKADYRFTTFLTKKEGNLSTFCESLVYYGISPEFFSDKYIYIGKDALSHLINGIIYWEDDAYKDDLDSLREQIMFLENLDGSLIVDCIRNIILDIKNINFSDNPDLYIFTNALADTKYATSSQNKAKIFYKSAVTKYKKLIMDPLPDNSENAIRLDIVKRETTSETIRKNLFLLIETYTFLLILDDNEFDVQPLYNFLGLDDDMLFSIYENENMINLPCREIARKLASYKVPISYFRTDSQTNIDCSASILSAMNTYFADKDIETFREKLYFQLGYQTDVRNVVIVMSMYALYRDLNYSDESTNS